MGVLKRCGVKHISNINGKFSNAYLIDINFTGESKSLSFDILKAKKYSAVNHKKQNITIFLPIKYFTP
ncbi:hypothetical protein Q765_07130 [Flavobacterium rivuli WB 3.3-2 = DSM 21788]|uniref:Uncharacterized protein n=1 Tax=Flavobacterium rivuli WB 3.3-2 = DSM 21788 TaxID=1121895 RepID=A0A0A2M716_9FLAO|nr:hypothetical protein Q765_07130 [Flavobacterium rivuli WB 3.3-2 = DSM 21788]